MKSFLTLKLKQLDRLPVNMVRKGDAKTGGSERVCLPYLSMRADCETARVSWCAPEKDIESMPPTKCGPMQVSNVRQRASQAKESKKAKPLIRCRQARWFQLVAAAGTSSKQMVPIGLGAVASFTADEDCELEFFANDVVFMYWNNAGVIHVAVTREA